MENTVATKRQKKGRFIITEDNSFSDKSPEKKPKRVFSQHTTPPKKMTHNLKSAFKNDLTRCFFLDLNTNKWLDLNTEFSKMFSNSAARDKLLSCVAKSKVNEINYTAYNSLYSLKELRSNDALSSLEMCDLVLKKVFS